MLLLMLCLAGCGAKPAIVNAPACDARGDSACLEIVRDGVVFYRRIDGLPTLTIDDGGIERTVVPLASVLQPDLPPPLDDWHLKIIAVDGFSHGGFADWTNIEHGYLEVGTRRVVFTADQYLPDTFRVHDAYRMELTRQ